MKALSDRLRTVPVRPVQQDDRNPGMPLDLDAVRALRVNRSAVERRAATIPTRRTVKKEWQAAWLLRAITCMDLTTLQGDDTPGNVQRLCAWLAVSACLSSLSVSLATPLQREPFCLTMSAPAHVRSA